LIGKGQPISLIEEFKRKNIRHAHEMGRPVSDAAKAKRKERRDESRSDRPPARFDTVLDAALAAAEAAGGVRAGSAGRRLLWDPLTPSVPAPTPQAPPR
jgi:hypothetical protein